MRHYVPTRVYETTAVIQPSLNDAEIDAQIEAIKTLIESADNRLIKNDVWGRRKLAYPVGRFNEGIYVFFVFEGQPEFIPALTRHYQITEPILRHLTVRCEVDPETIVVSLGDSRERPDRRRRPGPPGDRRDGPPPRRDGPRRDDGERRRAPDREEQPSDAAVESTPDAGEAPAAEGDAAPAADGGDE